MPSSLDKPSVILLDIEGTTTSISFVTKVLFPYARHNIRSFLTDNYDDLDIKEKMKEIKEYEHKHNDHLSKKEDIDIVCDIIYKWMDKNLKITPMKYLQGLIWIKGYKSQKLKGHLYFDAFQCINKWKKSDQIPIYIYSSGSVKAQRLLFGYSKYGDLNPLISGNFDTKIGDKKEVNSYHKIHKKISSKLNHKLNIKSILFISDNPLELIAAKKAGMTVIQSVRDDVTPDAKFTQIFNFHDIKWNKKFSSKL